MGTEALTGCRATVVAARFSNWPCRFDSRRRSTPFSSLGTLLFVDVDIVRRCVLLRERDDPVNGGLGEGLGGHLIRAQQHREVGSAEHRVGLQDGVVGPTSGGTDWSEGGREIGSQLSGYSQSAHPFPAFLAVAGEGCRGPVWTRAQEVGDDPDVAHRDGQALTDDRVVPAGGIADQHDPGCVGC